MERSDENNNAPSKNKEFPVFAKVLIISFAIILFTAILAFSLSDSEGELSMYYSPSESKSVIFKNGKETPLGASGRGMASIKFCENRSSLAVLTSNNSSYALYASDGDFCEKISENCENGFQISYQGETVAFIDSDFKFYKFNLRSKKLQNIDEGVKEFTLSPNGKNVLYSKDENGSSKLYLNSGAKTKRLGDNYSPLAASDNLNFIYVFSGDGSLCLLNKDGGMKSKLCSGAEDFDLYFSPDLKNVVFSDGSYTYVSKEGTSRLRIGKNASKPQTYDKEEYFLDSRDRAMVVKNKNLTDLYYASKNKDGYDIFYLSSDGKSSEIGEYIKNYSIARNGDLLAVSADGLLSLYKKSEGITISSDVTKVSSTKDNEYIYFINNKNELYGFHNDKTRMFASGVLKFYITSEGKVIFILIDGALYEAQKFKAPVEIDKNASECEILKNSVYYRKNQGGGAGLFDLYVLKDNGETELLKKGLAI